MTEHASSAAGEFRRSWPIVLTAAYGTSVGSSAMLSYPMPYFMQPLQAQFGWSRTAIALAVSLGTLGLAVSGPIAGRLCDRYGVRRVVPVSIVLISAALASLGLAHGGIALFYALYVLVAVGGGATSFGGYTRAVSGAFDRARGIALGLSLTGTGLMAFGAPLVLPATIAAHGWRAGYFVLAGGALLALLPALLFLREPRTSRDDSPAPDLPGLTLPEALRTRQFWFMFLAGVLTTAVVTGTQLHGISILTDLGAPKLEAEHTLALYGLSMIVARITVGLLVDRLHAPKVALVLYLFPAVGLSLLATGRRELAGVAFASAATVAAAEGDLLGFMISRYFGLKAYAEIFGWLVSSFCVGGMVGAALAGMVRDAAGDFRGWLFGSAAACLVVSALLGSLGRYRFGTPASASGEPEDAPTSSANRARPLP